ncbi:MAG: hypothetical protein E4H14_13440 [Candidatus Thorarchaeota archaeon]|nr:MAG: hypothetical protein E4H14_13440 [Candidatus Thorarchaeota archaeon]
MSSLKKSSCIVVLLLLVTVMITQSDNPLTNLNANQIYTNVIQSQEPLDSNLTWSARTQQSLQLVENNSVAAGDHVVVNGTFSPSLSVTECELNIWNGFTFSSNRSIIPVSDPDASFEGSIIYDDFDWIVIKGIERGLTVNITCNFTSENCDFMAWIGSMDPSLYSYSKSIVDMASDDRPEHDSFIWEFENDTMILGCLNTANSSNGSWTAVVQIGVNVTTSSAGSTIALDTYYLESRNQTCNIVLIGTTDTDETLTIRRDNVSLCNFFSPVIVVNHPVEINDEFTNISWSCTDLNQDDVNYFMVWISRDAGVTFVYLHGNVTQTTFIWDTSPWLAGDYIIRVVAYSCDTTSEKCQFDDPPDSYWPGDYTTAFSGWWAYTGFPTYTSGAGLDVDSVSDLTYEYGSTGNNVRLYLRFLYAPSSVDYIVRDNGTQWFEGDSYSASSVMVVVLNIDGLSLGIHEIEVDFLHNGHVLTTFTVYVIDSSFTPQIPFMNFLLPIGAIIGIVIITVFVKIRK